MFKSWIAQLRAWCRAFSGACRDTPKAWRRWIARICRCLRAVACRLWRLLCKGRTTPPREPPSRKPSIPISHPSFKRPDPLIYDQYYLMSLGLAVTWQNPDISILQGGVPVVSAYDLTPATTYQVVARIWNGSPDAVVSGLPVTFSYLSFGVQTQSHLIGQTVVDLGVKGSAHCPAFASMLWTTPATPGHYCLQVSFAWLDDSNPFNNLGQENTQVVKAASPASFTFTVGNPGRERAELRFEYDTYALPQPPPCPVGPTGGVIVKTATVGAPVAPTTATRHRRADFPLPPGWMIAFNPDAPVVAPGAEIDVTVTVDPPDTFHGELPINIHAFIGTRLVGGVTALVNRA